MLHNERVQTALRSAQSAQELEDGPVNVVKS